MEHASEGSEVTSPPSSVDEGSQYSEDESDDLKEVNWDAETEICLFESLAKYPPIGVNRYFSILNSSIYMQKRLNRRITPQQTYEHVKSLYNLEALEDDMELGVVDFSLPPDYTPLMEEREKLRKQQEADGTAPPQKKRRSDNKEKEKDKEKEKEKDKDKEKDKVHEEEGKGKIKVEPEHQGGDATSPSGSKYATFSEFIQGALAALGGMADLQTLYNYVAEHSQEVDKKYASRFENGTGKSSVGYKSNVRSTLHNNQCFTKLPSGMWTITPPGGTGKKKSG